MGRSLLGDDMEHILSLSYGKDSLACLGAIEQLGWPLDRIVHAEVWATDTIPADLPPMVRGQWPAVSHLHYGHQGRLLVLPQSGSWTAPAPAEKLP